MQNELYIVTDAIKALREARGLTQEQLAEKADISVLHLAKIETHARLMRMKTYIRLLEARDIPIKEHFIHMGTAKKDMMLKEKIWYLVQDCDERETSLLIYSIEGMKHSRDGKIYYSCFSYVKRYTNKTTFIAKNVQ